MRFRVSRVSLRSKEICPCDEATQQEEIIRNFPMIYWTVDIDDISELVEFATKYGELIIDHDKDSQSIEIYDDQR